MLTKEEFLNEVLKPDKSNVKLKANTYYNSKPEIKQFIDTYYPNKSVTETAYIIFYNITENPKCRYCGKLLKFDNFIHGYRLYCNKSCKAKDKNPIQTTPDKIINKQEVIDTFYSADGKLIEQRCLTAYLKKNGWYNPLMAYYPDTESCEETIYRIKHNLDIRPTCKICGKPLKFKHGFLTYCSQQCANKDPEVLLKNKQNVSKALKEAYINHGDDIKEKRRQTLMTKYNVDTPFSSPFAIKEIRDKAKNKINDLYNIQNVLQLSENRIKRINAQHKQSIEWNKQRGYNIDYINVDNEVKVLVHNCCPIHGDVIMDFTTFNNRTRKDRTDTTLCTLCNPLGHNETSIELIIKNILNELNVNYIKNDRTQISPYEIDYYLPEYKIGIECNGVYWHSGYDNGQRLLLKTQLCKEKGIKLFHLWEFDIHNKKDIIKDLIQKEIGIYKQININDCTIKKIDNTVLNQFINQNTINTYTIYNTAYGFFNNNILIGCINFNNNEISVINKIGYILNDISLFLTNYNIDNLIMKISNDTDNHQLFDNFQYVLTESQQMHPFLKFDCYDTGTNVYKFIKPEIQ